MVFQLLRIALIEGVLICAPNANSSFMAWNNNSPRLRRKNVRCSCHAR